MLIGEAVPVTAELAGEHPLAEPVGADNAVASRDLRILVDQAAEPVASSDAEVVLRRRGGDLGVGWCLAEGPMRPGGGAYVPGRRSGCGRCTRAARWRSTARRLRSPAAPGQAS